VYETGQLVVVSGDHTCGHYLKSSDSGIFFEGGGNFVNCFSTLNGLHGQELFAKSLYVGWYCYLYFFSFLDNLHRFGRTNRSFHSILNYIFMEVQEIVSSVSPVYKTCKSWKQMNDPSWYLPTYNLLQCCRGCHGLMID